MCAFPAFIRPTDALVVGFVDRAGRVVCNLSAADYKLESDCISILKSKLPKSCDHRGSPLALRATRGGQACQSDPFYVTTKSDRVGAETDQTDFRAKTVDHAATGVRDLSPDLEAAAVHGWSHSDTSKVFNEPVKRACPVKFLGRVNHETHVGMKLSVQPVDEEFQPSSWYDETSDSFKQAGTLRATVKSVTLASDRHGHGGFVEVDVHRTK